MRYHFVSKLNGLGRPVLFKLSAFALAFLLVITPSAAAFAQVITDSAAPAASDSSTPATTDSATTSTTSTSTDASATPSGDSTTTSSTTTTDTTTTTDSTDSTAAADSTSTPTPESSVVTDPSPTANTNLPPSSIKVLLPHADQTTGALVYDYPITIPSGRNGLQPDLKLSYNSQAMEEGSTFGTGWSMNIPYIERLNKTGSNNLYTDNYFTSSIDGELANISGSDYGPKVENGDFLAYSFSSNTWTVKDKKGTVYTYGSTAAARQDDPSDSTRIAKWMLQEVRDANNNYIKYEYYKNDGQIYPADIIYTGNGTTDGIYEVDFLRQSRTDVAPVYKTGFEINTNYRIYEIDIKTNSTLTHKYAISYTTGDNGVRSLLSSITESGTDESTAVTKTLPATSFTYQTGTEGWTADTSLTIPRPFAWYAGQDAGARVLDVNGDGLQDIVVSDGSSGVQEVYLNNGSGWTLDTSWTVPKYILDSGPTDTGFRFADINGDNLPDIIYSRLWNDDPAYPFSDEKYVYINNGSGWTLDTSWTIPVYFAKAGTYDTTARLADVNGDGLPDILVSNYQTSTKKVYINTGSSWVYDSSWSIPVYFNNYFGTDMGAELIDINGDGQADILYSDGSASTQKVYVNTGTGWVEDTTWGAIPEYFLDTAHHDLGVRFADVNSDGLMDIIRSFGDSTTPDQHVYINTGKAWVEDTSATLPVFFTSSGYQDEGARITDVKGSNLSDIIQYQHFSPGSDNKGVYYKNGHNTDLLSSITYPAGGTTNITYKQSTKYTDGGSPANPNQPFVLDTAYQITTSDGTTTSTDTYSYERGAYYYNTPLDRKFAGFGLITKTDSAGNVTKSYYHTGSGTDTTHGEYSDSEAKIGKPYRVEQYDSSGNLYTVTINKWDKYNLGTGRDFVKLVRATNLTYDGGSSHRDTATEYTYDNSTGNLTEQVNWGEVTGSDDGSFTDTGSDKSTEYISYVSGSSPRVVGLPYDDTLVDQSSTKVNETRTYYDSLSLGSVGNGNPAKVETWKSGSSYANTQKSYDGTYGIVTSSTDADGNATNYSYDSYHLYPTTVTDALSHNTYYTYDYSSGKTLQTTDPNGFVYLNVLDGLDRVIEQKIPGPVTKTTFAYTDTSGAVALHETDYLDGSTNADTYSYYDGLHRLIQTRKEAESSGTFNAKDYVYDSRGNLEKESLPYSSSGSSKTSPTSTTALYATYTYDPINRISGKSDAVGSTTYSYDRWKTAVTDALSHEKDYYKDAYGNLVQVDEHNGASTYSTYYEWNLNKNLTKITDALSNVRNFTYDGMGRRTSAEDLHAVGDATYGTWNYNYDDAGNITSSISPNGATTAYTYDALNRKLTENYTGAAGTEITYAYDTCTDGVTKLCSVQMLSGANTNYTYDSFGNIASEDRTITGSATHYITSYTYDRQGNILTLTYPDNAVAKYTYNTAGLLEKIERKESGGAYTNVVSNFDYAPTDQPSEIDYANGVTTTNTYDASHLYRLSNRTSVNSVPSNVQKMDYTYDAMGNITAITDSSDSLTAKDLAYTYDDLYRLTQAVATHTADAHDYTYNYTYNAIGDILTGPLGTYTYTGYIGTNYANPHAATSIGAPPVTYTYDNDGNLIQDTSTADAWMYNWNYKDQAVTINYGTALATYTYDQDGNRVHQIAGLEEYFPNKYYTKDVTNGYTYKDIYAGSTLVATIMKNGSTITPYYIHPDQVQSTQEATDSTSGKVQTIDYYPFGGERMNTGGLFQSKHQYGSHYQDINENLSYYGARYYDYNKGQFVSEDPIFLLSGATNFSDKWNNSWLRANSSKPDNKFNLQENNLNEKSALQDYLSNPQNLNSYSYVTNNPIRNIDPNGEFELHVSFTTNAGLGAGAGNTWSFGIASDGSYGSSLGWHAGGFAGGDASIGVSLGYSNAKTWGDTGGKSGYAGIGGKIGIGVDASANFSEDGKFSGVDVGTGAGPSTPIYMNGGISNTTIIVNRNVKQDLQGIVQSVSNALSPASQGLSKLFDSSKK